MKKYLSLLAVLVLGAIGSVAAVTYANPSQIQEHASATATSTLAYMTSSIATSTNAFDTQSDGGFPAETATIAFQVNATNTGVAATTTLMLHIEDSSDNIDWYPRAIAVNAVYPATPATTTEMIVDEMVFKTGSTTNLFLGPGAPTRTHYSVSVPARLRYIRGVFRVPVGGGNIGLWSDVYIKKQSR